MRKKFVLLQALAILIAVLQCGMRAGGQDEGENSNRTLSNIFYPYLAARMPLACSSVDEWLVTTGHMNRVRIRVHRQRIYQRYSRTPLWMVLPQILIGNLYTYGSRKARTVWLYCTYKVYHYQLNLKSVLFYTLMKCGALKLVTEMLLMMSGDIELNPGPTTHFKPHDLTDLSLLLQDVAGYWVAIADQLGMEPQVATIRRSPDNVVPSDCLKDLLDRWINQENPATLETLCHVLSDCPEIVEGAGVAMKLKEKFQLQRENISGFETEQTTSKDSLKRTIQDTVPKPMLKELVTLQISDWYDLGLQLDIPENDLDIIKKDNPLDFRGARRTMFQTWLRRCTEANYQQLINALCIVGDEKVAASLCGKYGISMQYGCKKQKHSTEVEGYAIYIKEVYRDLSVFPEDDWPPRLTDHYIDLMMICHEKISPEESMIGPINAFLHGTADFLCCEHAIDLQHLFKSDQYLASQILSDSSSAGSSEQADVEAESGLDSSEEYITASEGESENEHKITKSNETTVQAVPHSALESADMHSSLSTDVVDDRDLKNIKILVDGPPGVGKSTLCRKACKDWAEGLLLEEYKLVVYVPLREDGPMNASCIHDLLCFGTPSQKMDIAHGIEQSEGEDVLFILDGWDELPHEKRKKNSFLSQVILGRVCRKCSVLVTSRPSASVWLRRLSIVYRHVEIFGFTENQIRECATQAFPVQSELVEKFMVLFHIFDDIRRLCYIPLNLAILLYVFRVNNYTLPTSLAKVYEIFTNNTLLRHLELYSETQQQYYLKDKESLPDLEKALYKTLCKLALNGLIEDQLVFSSEQLSTYHSMLPYGHNTLGLMTASKTFTVEGISLRFQFIHLTIQEYLASEELLQQPLNYQVKFLFKHRNDKRFKLMILFYCGKAVLTEKFTEVFALPPEHLYKDCMSGHYQERLVQLMHMIYQSRNEGLASSLAHSLNSSLTLSQWNLSLSDCGVLARFLRWSSQSWKLLNMCNCSITDKHLTVLAKLLKESPIDLSVKELKLGHGNRCSCKAVYSLITTPPFQAIRSLDLELSPQPDSATSTLEAMANTVLTLNTLSHIKVRLSYDLDQDMVDESLKAVSTNLALTSVSIKGSHRHTVTSDFFESKINLKSLRIFGMEVGRGFIQCLQQPVSSLTNIQELHLHYCKLYCVHAYYLFSWLKSNSQLRILNLRGNENLFSFPTTTHKCQDVSTQEAATAMKLMLASNSTVHSLNLTACGITAEVAKELSHGLTRNEGITDLDLSGNQLREGAVFILESLTKSVDTARSAKKVMNLSLQDCLIDDQLCKKVFSTMPHLFLKRLDVSVNFIGEEGTIALFETLEKCETLEHLNLSANELVGGDKLAAAITTLLSINTSLTELDLSICNLSDAEFQAISNGLMRNATLQALVVGVNRVTADGVKLLFQALEQNRTLQKLTLRDSPLLNTGVQSLVRMLERNNSLIHLNLVDCDLGSEENAGKIIASLHKNVTLTELTITFMDCKDKKVECDDSDDIVDSYFVPASTEAILQELDSINWKRVMEGHPQLVLLLQ